MEFSVALGPKTRSAAITIPNPIRSSTTHNGSILLLFTTVIGAVFDYPRLGPGLKRGNRIPRRRPDTTSLKKMSNDYYD